jgi:hypothetical protein
VDLRISRIFLLFSTFFVTIVKDSGVRNLLYGEFAVKDCNCELLFVWQKAASPVGLTAFAL